MPDEVTFQEITNLLQEMVRQQEQIFEEVLAASKKSDFTQNLPIFLKMFERVKSISYNRGENETKLEIVVENADKPMGTQKEVNPLE